MDWFVCTRYHGYRDRGIKHSASGPHFAGLCASVVREANEYDTVSKKTITQLSQQTNRTSTINNLHTLKKYTKQHAPSSRERHTEISYLFRVMMTLVCVFPFML